MSGVIKFPTPGLSPANNRRSDASSLESVSDAFVAAGFVGRSNPIPAQGDGGVAATRI